MSDKKLTLKDDTAALSAAIQAGLKLDKAGNLTEEAKDHAKTIYAKSLPEGVTIEQVETIDKFNTTFGAAALHAVGEVSIPVMKKNADLQQVGVSFNTAGKNAFDVIFNRETKSRNPKTGEDILGFGGSSLKFDMYGAGNSRGEVKVVRQILADKAAAVLG